MAGTLRGDVRLESELTGVKGTRLSFADGSAEQFDEVVLTLPPPCLERIGLSGFGIEMSPTCKVALVFSQQFWDEGGLLSDLAVQQVWPCGQALVCYINGRGMEELVASGDPVEEALASLSGVYPEARAYFLAGRLVDWKAERFSLGGFPFVPVGSSRPPVPIEGPVRFAGDWTAEWFGFVEGALESAERVVSEIKNEHGLS
jgi:monoamine oxidase